MKILFIGDVVGSPGRKMLSEYIPKLKTKYMPDLIVVNGENASSGKGLNKKAYQALLQLGVHVITMGNHTWDQKELLEYIEDANHLVRPANYPEGTPGKGYTSIKIGAQEVVIINLQGRTFLPPLDCPFKKVDEILESFNGKNPYIFVDFHAEATSEKIAMGWYLDGRVGAVVGTHTHVQTADERILPNGTAYITDVGMTGPYNGILGVESDAVIRKFVSSMPVRFEVAKGPTQLSGVVIDIDSSTKKAKSIKRVLINDDHHFFE